MLAAGRRTWSSPDVLPWGAWLERELDRARIRGEAVPRRLSRPAAWLLWREAVLQAAEAHQVLAPLRLIDTVRASVALLEDYGVEPATSDSAEATLLLAARAHFRDSCRTLGALDSGSWLACSPFVQPAAPVLLAGFAAVGPAMRQWLGELGARVPTPTMGASQTSLPKQHGPLAAPPGHARREAQSPRVVRAQTISAEAEAAADWCARHLAADRSARLLLVVPRLAEQRHQWQRALSQRLDYQAILHPAADAGTVPASAYAIEGGQPLDSFPMVRAALAVVGLGADRLDFESLSALLRSPYLPAWDLALRCRLDVWLRQQNVDAASRATLEAIRGRIARELGPAAAGVLESLLEDTAGAARDARGRAEAGTAASAGPIAAPGYAQLFAACLAAAGWPGSGLSSEELQVRMRFDELLGDLAAAEALRAVPTLSEAATLLRELASRTSFEAASDDVAVTVTSTVADPIVRYDGIWVAGLTADVWPAPVQPDALLPLSLQLTAGVPQVSAEAQLRRARQLQHIWAECAVDCVFSWPASEDESPCEPSPLLRELAAPPHDLTAPAPTVPQTGHSDAAAQLDLPFGAAVQESFCLEQWLAALQPPLVPWRDASGPRWATPQALPGGTKLLELQALCPFRGFTQLRLGAVELPRPRPGVDERWRGQILHRSLELLWQQLGDSASLQGSDPQAFQGLVRRCASQATRQLLEERGTGVFAELLQRERERVEALLLQVLAWERAREPFCAQALESKRPLVLGEGTLRLRLDRVDRLTDGRLAVIDYKSGRDKGFDPLAERLTQPQLPLYAVTLGEAVAAVFTLHIRPGSLRARGIADRADRIQELSGPPPGVTWSELLARWQGQLQALAREFLDGHAAVAPQADACEHCHLHTLCRIDPSAWTVSDDSGEAEDAAIEEGAA